MVQAEQAVARSNHAVQAGLFDAEGIQELPALSLVEFGDFRFDPIADRHHWSALLGGNGSHLVEQGVVVEAVLGDVGDVQHRLGGQQVQFAQPGAGVAVQGQRAHRGAGLQAFAHLPKQCHEGDGILVPGARHAADAVGGPLHGVEVGQGEFGVDDLDVIGGRHLARHVHDVAVPKAAHHVGDGMGLANVGQELVAEPLALGGAGDQAGDIDEFHGGGHHLGGLDDIGDAVQARVRHRDDAGVGINGAEGEVLRVDARPGEGVEQGGLAHVGQADDAAVESHQPSWPDPPCSRFITVCSLPSAKAASSSSSSSNAAAARSRSSAGMLTAVR